MQKPYILYGWPLSLYSGKARAYLRYKGIDFVEREVRLWTLRRIEKKVGARVMPVVVTPEGEWLQDTSHIIDVIERRHPLAPVVPGTPRQRVAAYLLEAWGDEFWLPTAMHYRWSFAENFERCFEPEGGNHLLPFAPRFIKKRLIAGGAAQMRRFLPGLGVEPGQVAAIEAWTVAMLDALDAHFAQLPYLLGHKPGLGDFGLIGPLYAHLGRDPYPARELIAPRPHLKAWIARMQQPPRPQAGAFLSGDRVPDTLAPVFGSLFGEFWPQLQATQALVQKRLPLAAKAQRLPRMLDPIEIPLGASRFRLGARPYSLWMAQRALDAYRTQAPGERAQVDAWLAELGAPQAMALAIEPRLERVGLRVRAA